MDTVDLLWILFVLLVVGLHLPVTLFLIRGWDRRKNSILSEFGETSAQHYLMQFHHLSSPQPAAKTNGKNGSPHLDRLKALYDTQFRKRRYAIPLVLMIGIVSTLLSAAAISAIGWLKAGSVDLIAGHIDLAVALSIAGAYTWVLYDQIDKYARDDILPADLYWATFRFVIAVPMAYALSKSLNGSLALTASYLLGTFPTATIMTAGRRLIAKPLGIDDVVQDSQSMTTTLPSVDGNFAERLSAEGITTVYQLAYCDPVMLAIRTGYRFTTILVAADEALAHIYFRENADKARKVGLNGAIECSDLWDDLNAPEGEPRQLQAGRIVAELAERFGISNDALRNVLCEIAEDPYARFYSAIWDDKNERSSLDSP